MTLKVDLTGRGESPEEQVIVSELPTVKKNKLYCYLHNLFPDILIAALPPNRAQYICPPRFDTWLLSMTYDMTPQGGLATTAVRCIGCRAASRGEQSPAGGKTSSWLSLEPMEPHEHEGSGIAPKNVRVRVRHKME
jgi:hypothetical protein